jgi:hypothetical protein
VLQDGLKNLRVEVDDLYMPGIVVGYVQAKLLLATGVQLE